VDSYLTLDLVYIGHYGKMGAFFKVTTTYWSRTTQVVIGHSKVCITNFIQYP